MYVFACKYVYKESNPGDELHCCFGFEHPWGSAEFANTPLCKNTVMHVRMYTHVQTCTYMHVHTCTHMHVRPTMYIHQYVCKYAAFRHPRGRGSSFQLELPLGSAIIKQPRSGVQGPAPGSCVPNPYGRTLHTYKQYAVNYRIQEITLAASQRTGQGSALATRLTTVLPGSRRGSGLLHVSIKVCTPIPKRKATNLLKESKH